MRYFRNLQQHRKMHTKHVIEIRKIAKIISPSKKSNVFRILASAPPSPKILLSFFATLGSMGGTSDFLLSMYLFARSLAKSANP